jgi:hypothetical protein
MNGREVMVREVAGYLQEHFPEAKIGSAQDALTQNEVFTVIEGDMSRHVEITDRWFDQDTDVIPLRDAIRTWGLADKITGLEPNGILRVATTGFEQVP